MLIKIRQILSSRSPFKYLFQNSFRAWGKLRFGVGVGHLSEHLSVSWIRVHARPHLLQASFVHHRIGHLRDHITGRTPNQSRTQYLILALHGVHFVKSFHRIAKCAIIVF